MKKVITFTLLFLSIISYSQIDSLYYENSKTILKNYKKSRITAEQLYNIANEVNDSLGIVVPYELAISQALLETGLGSTGVGKNRNNPFSINSSKGYRYYDKIEDGIRAYYYLMARRYLKCRTYEQLLTNFVNCNNKRYAEYKGYENDLKNQIKYFQRKFF